MKNEMHLYSTSTDPMTTIALYILPHIHTPTPVSAMQGAIQPFQEQLGLGVLLMDTHDTCSGGLNYQPSGL